MVNIIEGKIDTLIPDSQEIVSPERLNVSIETDYSDKAVRLADLVKSKEIPIEGLESEFSRLLISPEEGI